MKKDKGKKILFIDRDGTLIREVPPTYQVDSFDKLTFFPEVFTYMKKIASLNFELVMVTNQDGLGTASFPEETFWPVQHFVIRSFENEGVHFKEIMIDRSFVEDNNPNRKPGTGMMSAYLHDAQYNIPGSFVIGDRITDMQLAHNLGCKGIWLKDAVDPGAGEVKNSKKLKKVVALTTLDWKEIYKFLKDRNKKSN